jgi:DNA-binding NarL/FixJ family response regulator
MNRVNAQLSVLIISPPGRWRSSLCVLLHANTEINAVYQADDCAVGLQALAETHSDIVLLDSGLPGEECWLALEQIRHTQPRVRCVVLAHDSAQEQHALHSGADGVLQVGFSGEILYATIHSLRPSR